MEETEKPKSDKMIWISILAIVIAIAALLINVAQLSPSPSSLDGKFCMTSTPKYLLSCFVDNKTIAAVADAENYQMAVEKNNCTVLTTQDQLDIVFCNQNVSNYTTKYKLVLEPYKA